MSSRIPGFYKLAPADRLNALDASGSAKTPCAERFPTANLSLDDANLMVENVISTFALPNAVAVNFLVDGEEILVPMVVEEPSVVAAVTNMAKLARQGGGFTTDVDPGVMIGQVQLRDVKDPARTLQVLDERTEELLDLARAVHPRLERYGGGIRGIEARSLRYDEPGESVENMVVVHIHVDCADAMGANMVNTVAERLAPHIASMTGERVGLKILSNLADQRIARARLELPVDAVGKDVAHAIASAWRFAWADPYRACTHNKGVMNGIDSVCLATGNDWRAVEAGAHAYACQDGSYRPLTRWHVREDRLIGSIALPLQLGTVGGPIRVHPTVQANLAMMGVRSARHLSGITAAVGLSQNLAALRALATEGIQAGHMRMHARTVAATAGATPGEVPKIIDRLCSERDYSVDRAKQIVAELRKDR